MEYKDICILHTNDMHSYIENFPKRAAIIKKIREENKKNGIKTYLFDSGDIFSGSIYFNIFKGNKEIELMNELNYDAVTIGNHEFDQGDKLINKLLELSKFPIVSSNIKIKNRNKIESIFKEYLKLEDNIYIIATTTQETVEVSSPIKEYIFENPTKVIINKIKFIREKNENAHIFLLSHLGVNKDIELLQYNLGINVIIGGHTHTVLEEPIKLNKGLIVQAGQYGKYVGVMYLRLYSNGESKLLDYNLNEVNLFEEEDEKLYKMVNEAMEISKNFKFKYIGETKEDLIGDRKSLNENKANLAYVVTDALIYKAEKMGYAVDASLINGWGIRNSIKAGEVYLNDLINVLPFSLSILIVEIRGEDLITALNEGICPYFSKIEFKEGEYYFIKNEKLEKIELSKKYKIVTNSFVAEGKDNYQTIKKGEILKNIGLDVDILSEYMEIKYKK